MTHARSFIKVGSTYLETEEVRLSNTVNQIIGTFYRWHWLAQAATNISISNGVQDYSLAAGDQNTTMAIQNGYLTDASTTYPAVLIEGNNALPVIAETGRPYCIGLLSPTEMRFFPTPNLSYTLHWRKYKRPTVFTANTDSFDCPSAYDAIVKAGVVWQALEYKDDTRSEGWRKTFYDLLQEHKNMERVTMGRTR
jgi:hypothetical protein